MTTSKELAAKLNGRQYRNEISHLEERLAMESRLVVAFAYSDDNCEFRGAIHEEIPCFEGGQIHFNNDGTNFTDERGESFLTYHKDKEFAEKNMIEAVWCDSERLYHEGGDYFSWFYKTTIPHETFDIFDDEQPFCKGIVFSIDDLI